jgi:hypothetical protein
LIPARRRAAYFLARADHVGRPLDDGIISAITLAGFDLDLFIPGDGDVNARDVGEVRLERVEYSQAWLRRQLRSWSRWQKYAVLLGACDLPMAFAGVLSFWSRRPSVAVCDEIYLGRQGPARGGWKAMSRWAIRRARLSVVTDRCRLALLNAYTGSTRPANVLEYPACFVDGVRDESRRRQMRAKLGIAADEFVVSISGGIHEYSGAPELVAQFGLSRGPVRLMIQAAGSADPLTETLLQQLAETSSLLFFPRRVSYSEAAAISGAADVGVACYFSQSPQDQTVGLSSQKLCSYLRYGVPVIVSRQDSFSFVERFGCGVLIGQPSELASAVERIRSDWPKMSAAAWLCFREFVRTAQKRDDLAARLRSL